MAPGCKHLIRCCLVVCALSALAGCHSFMGYRGWPFPDYERTSFHTPAMRIDTVKQFAAKADGTDSQDQRALTDQLARQIQIEPDPLVRETIIRAAADFKTPLAEQMLEAGLGDENAAVRVACCQTLGKRADAAGVPKLAQALRGDKDNDVRQAAAMALGHIKTPDARAALSIALEDRDPAMQYAGMQSMKSITGKDYGPDIKVWREVAAGGNPPEATPTSIAERVKAVPPFSYLK